MNIDPIIINLAILLIAAYPLAFIYSAFLHNAEPLYKHLYSIITSTVLFTCLFPISDFLHPFAICIAVYTIMYFKIGGNKAPMLVFVYSMGHLAFNHLQSQILSNTMLQSARFDATAPMMVLVIKLTSFAWTIQDDKSKGFPGIIPFLGFIFFFGGFLVGPSILFQDYMDFIETKPPFDKIPKNEKYFESMKCLGISVLSFLFHVKFEGFYDYNNMVDEQFIQQTSFFYKIFFAIVCGLTARTKYYTAWKLSEGACILSGLGFNPGENRNQFNRLNNVDILHFEFPENSRQAVACWNIQTAHWLKRDVYERLGGLSSSLRTLLTLLTSAVWHGFFPGYYLFFLTASLMTQAARQVRSKFRPLFLNSPLKPLYDLSGTLTMILLINYMAVPFQVLTLEKSWKVWKSLWFYGHFIIAIAIGSPFFMKKNITKSQKVSNKKEE